MNRAFNEHKLRRCEGLNHRWAFVTAEQRRDRGTLPKLFSDTIQVPSAWEQKPGLEAYRGKAWYRTSVDVFSGKALRLLFGGVSHTADVYVDGKKVTHHYDAFTPFDAVVPCKQDGACEVIVAVDNTFGDHSALHIDNDYFTYGGLTRPVVAEWVPPVYIDRLSATPKRTGATWELEVKVRLKNWSNKAIKRSVLVLVGGETVDLGSVTVKGKTERVVSGSLTQLKVDAWSPDAPNLYEVVATLSDGDEIVDDLIDRVGFRQIEVKGKKLLLNGNSLRLRGFNRHEDHPQFGNALPLEAVAHDLERFREMGCNFLRTSHYPNDMRMLDLCDEMGICVWEESHARSVDFKHPMYKEQITKSTVEMLDWHHNHASILMWGCLNECESETAVGAKEHARVLKLIKKTDPSRPITFASNRGQNDLAFGYVDIVSWNLYDSWYGGGLEHIEPRLKTMLKWLHSPKSRGGSGKPVIMSEFGAGGIYGNRNPNRAKWTEDYQRDVLDESLRVYLNHPDIVGAAIWQFCDVRVTDGQWSKRPRTMNNKGIVDEYRRPKLAYEAVKRRMLEAKKTFEKTP
jgi:beta-glucuronidase